jgi:hypothetical protein
VSAAYVRRHQKSIFKNKKTPNPRSRLVRPRSKPTIIGPPCTAPLPCLGHVTAPLPLGHATSPTPPSGKAHVIALPPHAMAQPTTLRRTTNHTTSCVIGHHHASCCPAQEKGERREGKEMRKGAHGTMVTHLPGCSTSLREPPQAAAGWRRLIQREPRRRASAATVHPHGVLVAQVLVAREW